MRFLEYITEARPVKFTKLKLKRNGPGSYSADIGRIYVSVWQAESKQFWGAEVTIGKYGDDDFSEENMHASSKKELIGYIENHIKKNKDAINRTDVKRY